MAKGRKGLNVKRMPPPTPQGAKNISKSIGKGGHGTIRKQ